MTIGEPKHRGPRTTVPWRPSAYVPPPGERNTARWRINGFPATIIIWTQEEWDRLEVRPDDAQYYPCGIWCALRIDTSA